MRRKIGLWDSPESCEQVCKSSSLLQSYVSYLEVDGIGRSKSVFVQYHKNMMMTEDRFLRWIESVLMKL